MADKKRKRSGEDGEQPKKKKSVKHASSTVTFTLADDIGQWQPLVAATPGLEMRKVPSLDAYSKSTQSSERDAQPELLLHSSSHTKLDYTAREESSGSADTLLKHYVGVYDPASGEVKIFPSQKVVLRSTLRTQTTLEEDIEEIVPAKAYGARVLLGEAFGTKKSQKALRAVTENAIASPANRRDAEGKPVLDASAAAILDTVAATSSSMPNKAAHQAAIDEAKPRPKADLITEDPTEVYTLQELVRSDAFAYLEAKPWAQAVKKGKDVPTTSQFVSQHLHRIVEAGDTEQIKALQFLLYLIQWYSCLKSGGKDGKKLPRREEVQAAVPDAHERLLDIIRKRFAPNGTLNRWFNDYLVTHICALALVLDRNCETDVYYLREDLGLEIQQITRYFQELGCRITSLSETDRKKTNLTKAAASSHRMAKLRIPLEFPQVRLPKKRSR